MRQNPINARKGITTASMTNWAPIGSNGQNPINARKGITTIGVVGDEHVREWRQNPINARKGITTRRPYRAQRVGKQSESY